MAVRYLASIAIIRFVDSSVIATRCDPPLRLPYACARITYLKSPYTLKLKYPFLSASTKRKNDHRYMARYERSLLRHHLSKPLSPGTIFDFHASPTQGRHIRHTDKLELALQTG